MATSFNSSNAAVFSNIGITSTVTGITVSQYLYDSSSGQTSALTSFVPSPLNYVLTSDSGTVITDGTTTAVTPLPNCVAAITIPSGRIAEICAIGSSSNSQLTIQGDLNTSSGGYFLLYRGLTLIQSQRMALLCGLDANPVRAISFPPHSIRFFDLSPPAGGITYSFAVQNIGITSVMTISNISLFVRQI